MESTCAKIALTDKCMPKGTRNPKEAELKNFLSENFDPNLGREIASWWLAHPQYRTPNWDLVSTCTINNEKGILLVEAKAHFSEMKENDKCGSTNKDNSNQIEKAIEEAKTHINKTISPDYISISRDKCYQLSNRVAHAWWLADKGIPVVLIYLGFLNAVDMLDGHKRIFETIEQWKTCFTNYSKKVGVDGIVNQEIRTGKSGFKLIVGCI